MKRPFTRLQQKQGGSSKWIIVLIFVSSIMGCTIFFLMHENGAHQNKFDSNVLPGKLRAPISSTILNNQLVQSQEHLNKAVIINTNNSIEATKFQRKKKIAFAITMTRDGPFHDGAAVLAYSIAKAFGKDNIEIGLFAFVHPKVQSSRPFLRNCGYRIVEAPTPVNVSEIQGVFLRDHINDKAGCCGAAELIKLYSYRLVDYDRVVHLDADVLIMQSFSELFDDVRSFIYTTDPNMTPNKNVLKMPTQGGFILLTPSIQDYQSLVHIIMKGDYREGSGWGGSHIGWFYGGRTIQGVLPYYYNEVSKNRSLIVDRCIYNSMADEDNCTATPLHLVKFVHFTVCIKPWNCGNWYLNDMCRELHKLWRIARKETEEFYGIQSPKSVCESEGKAAYTQLDLLNARVPDDAPFARQTPETDMSLYPLPGAGFVEGRGYEQVREFLGAFKDIN